MLESENRLRVKQMVFTLTTPLVLTAQFQLAVRLLLRAGQERFAVAVPDCLCNGLQANAADRGKTTREVFVQELLVQAHDIGQLCAAIRRHRGDAHLRHHFQQSLDRRFRVVIERGLEIHIAQGALFAQLVDCFVTHVGVNGIRAESDQHGDIVDLADISCLHDQGGPRTRPLTHQVLVDGGGQQERRNRRKPLIRLAVAQHDQRFTVGNRIRHLAADASQGFLDSTTTMRHGIQTGDNGDVELRELSTIVGVNKPR